MSIRDLPVVRLTRFAYSDEGTRGKLYLPSGEVFCTMELPWKGNRRRVSCIPVGSYQCVWGRSPKSAQCSIVLDVKGRAEILFHNGNYAGDPEKGYKTDSEGCILVGSKHGILSGQRAVTGSLAARALFERVMAEQSFLLEIVSE